MESKFARKGLAWMLVALGPLGTGTASAQAIAAVVAGRAPMSSTSMPPAVVKSTGAKVE